MNESKLMLYMLVAVIDSKITIVACPFKGEKLPVQCLGHEIRLLW